MISNLTQEEVEVFREATCFARYSKYCILEYFRTHMYLVQEILTWVSVGTKTENNEQVI